MSSESPLDRRIADSRAIPYLLPLSDQYVVDASDDGTVAHASVELMRLLAHRDLRSTPVFLVFHKLDAPVVLSRTALDNVFYLDMLMEEEGPKGNERLRVFAASAMTGEGTQALLDKVLEAVG